MKMILLVGLWLGSPSFTQESDPVGLFEDWVTDALAGTATHEQFIRALQAARELDWDEEANLYESVIYGPDSPNKASTELHPQWSQRLLEVGRYELAEAEFEALATDQDGRSIVYRGQLANLCIARGDFAGFAVQRDRAMGLLEDSVVADWWVGTPYNGLWRNLDLQFELATGQFQAAFKSWKALPEETPARDQYKRLRQLDYYLAKRKHQRVIDRVAERSWTGGAEVEVRRRLARALWEGDGEVERAKQVYEEQVKASRSDLRFEALVYLAEMELLQGEVELAETRWQEARLALEEWLQWAGEEYAPLETTALFCALGVRIERELEQAVSRARADALVDATNRLLRRWEELSNLGTEMAFLDVLVRRQVLVDRVTLELEQGAKEAALEILWKVQSKGSLARAIGDPSGFTQALQDTARPHWLPLLGRHGGWGFWVEDGEIEVHTLPDSRSLDDLVMKLDGATRQVLDAAKAGDEFNLADVDLWAGQLAEGILPPPLREGRAQACTIVGSSILGNVPLDLLPVPRGEVKAMLGEAIALDYLPSWPCATALRARQGGKGALCLYALDKASQQPERYQLSEEQREGLTSNWGAGLDLRMGSEASLDALREADLEEFSALLLLAHGLEARRALRFPDEEELDEELVLKLASPPLVLLGACRAGRGRLQRGNDALAGLGDAWLQAGAACVIASPQDLEQDVVVELAARLAASPGVSPSEVLRGQRREEADPLRRLQLGWVRALGAGQ